ncbi:hypothetical protein V6N13_004508 [Hibiscus sabdariffa]
MLRRATGILARPISAATNRPFSTYLPAAHTADATFVEAWNKVMPNMDPPKTPLSFMQPRPPTPSSIPSKLTINFVLPYASEYRPQLARWVFFRDTLQQFAELKPRVLSVHEGNETTKYLVNSGFVFIHANSFADIIAVEAVPLHQIDAHLVQKGLAEFTQKLSSATTDSEKAEEQTGIDVHSALNSALTGQSNG